MRLEILRAVTLLALLLVGITELLSLFTELRPTPLKVLWAAVVCCGLAVVVKRQPRLQLQWKSLDPVVWFAVLGCSAILLITAVTAVVSPPNSADAMAYHLPRIIYWAEQSSVRFFPATYLTQIMLQPFAEYVGLHLYLLTGSDHLINLIQWFASGVSIVAVSLAASWFGAGDRGQAIASLFCATIPAGVLASSGAKNDYVLAMWMVITVCFALRFATTASLIDAMFLGFACGLALLTKGTAYLFLPWPVAAILLPKWRALVPKSALIFTCALIVNTPIYLRNIDLSGSPLGFDSAHANGVYRWRNERLGWKETSSNLLRHTSDQLGGRSDKWNQSVYEAVLSAHEKLGIDPNDSATTWPYAKFTAPANANHEANVPNRFHLAALLGVTLLILWARDRERALYVASLVCGFLAFCAYLKWQPFMARLILPLFVTASPLMAVVGELRGGISTLLAQLALCFFLLDTARLPALQNWVRPLKGPSSILKASRQDLYFADLTPWNNKESYVQSAEFVAKIGCDIIGLDTNKYEIEYPLIALVRERKPWVQFVHTEVVNPSRKYPQPITAPPCAIVCLECAGDASRLENYSRFERSNTFGRFVVFW